MTPERYEAHVADVLGSEGWRTSLTPATHDMGLDVIAERPGERLGVQVKMYGLARPVNAAIVMHTYGAAAYADCAHAMVATNARVLADAEQVAAKLRVVIRHIPAVETDPPPAGSAGELTFGAIWNGPLKALVGQSLTRANGRENTVLSVDGGGLIRRTSNGRAQRVEVEIFRWTIERLLAGQPVLREEINAQCIGRVSSGVMLILSALPMFESVVINGKTALTRSQLPNHGGT